MKLVAMFPHKGDFPPMGGSSNIAPSNLPIDGQWMSQSAYQNIDLDTVDWAVLAQQWIHMKETCPAPAEPMVNAPPPPRFTSADYEEQGEAPMEVDDDQPNVMNAPPPPTNIFQTNNWNSESGQHGHHQKKWNRSSDKTGGEVNGFDDLMEFVICRRESLESKPPESTSLSEQSRSRSSI